MFKKLAVATACAAAFLAVAAPASAVPVSTELALLVDVSGSVDNSEYNLQKAGYVSAFRDSGLQAAITALSGGIAVTYIEWASFNEQSQLVNWFHITDAASANAFADLIEASSRAFFGNTAVANAISYVTPQFASNGYEGGRWVIDVSGDGEDNDSDLSTTTARDNALAAGVTTINGLPIGGGAGLQTWYTDNVKGGAGSFVLAADSFADFEATVKQKIEIEITELPEPATLALMLAGAGLIGVTRRRKS